MSLIQVRRPWTRQPPQFTQYADQVISDLGLCGGAVISEPLYAVAVNKARTPAAVNGAGRISTEVSRYGRALRYEKSSSAASSVMWPTGSPSARDFTYAARIYLSGITGTGVVARSDTTATTAAGTTIPLWRSSGGAWDMRINGTDYTAAGTVTQDTWHDVEIVGTASSCTLYVDGAAIISGGAAAAGNIQAYCGLDDAAGGSGILFGSAYVLVSYAVWANRAWTDAERAAWRYRPWRVLRDRRIPIPVAAASGPPTLVSVSGVSTAPTTATITVTSTGSGGSTLYLVAYDSSLGTPSDAQIAAGLDINNVAAAWDNGGTPWAGSGQQAFAAGLTGGANLRAAAVVHDPVGGYSNVVVSAAWTQSVNGTASITLAGVSCSAAGALAIVGAAAVSLDGATLSAEGSLVAQGSGSLATTLDGATLSAAAQLAIAASADITLEGATLTAEGALTAPGTGALSKTLDGATVSAAGHVDIAAALGVTLGDLVLTSAARVSIEASAAITMAGVSLSSAGGETAVTTAAVAARFFSLPRAKTMYSEARAQTMYSPARRDG